ncbi:MAG: DUF885 family protein [Pseudomonadales bacterium]|jgi:uncharacterized protein (DUF885 family)|nr:DUF885 family protein [Pseudomonadales bacterium]MDP7316087.1 DUF885 family protein [Pseudomonadales bacterium]|tara:strand:- start:141 stop:311 length:171 start_codon:yes stop_codon:yes gene_type:complete
MVGMNQLLLLRQEAEERLDTEYDIRKFHQTALAQGALALVILNQVIDEWLDSYAVP